MNSWDKLSMAEKAEVMRVAVEGGVYDLDAIRSGYNEYAKGGKIHIAPSKRGTFTAAASKHGKSVQAFASQVLAHPENYSPAMVKKANFARNASKWKHGDGGLLESTKERVAENNQFVSGGNLTPEEQVFEDFVARASEDPMVIIAKQNPEYKNTLAKMYEDDEFSKAKAGRLLEAYKYAGKPKLKTLPAGKERAYTEDLPFTTLDRPTLYLSKDPEEGFHDLIAELSHPLQAKFGNNKPWKERLNLFYSEDDYRGKTRYDFPNKYESETHQDFEPLLDWYVNNNVLPGQKYITYQREGILGDDNITTNPQFTQVMDSARVYNKRKQDSNYQYKTARGDRKPRNKILSFFGDLF